MNKASQSDEPRFDVEMQTATTITNVGGGQTVNMGGSVGRGATVGRYVAALGLALLFTGLGMLVLTIARTAQAVPTSSPGPQEPYDQYIATTWQPAVILLVTGVVISRFGRLFAGR